MITKAESVVFNRDLMLSNAKKLYEIYVEHLDKLEIEKMADGIPFDNLKHAAIRKAMREVEHLSPYLFGDSEYFLMKHIVETKGQ